jgi:hypothetical protein
MTEQDIKPLATVQDHIERFIDYSRKDGRKHRTASKGKTAKSMQNEFAVAWYGSQKKFQWWRTYGFTNLRRAASEPIRLEARTASAQAHLIKWAAEHSGAEVKVIEVDERDAWGIPTGRKVKKLAGMFVIGATQGGRSNTKLTDMDDFTKLRHALAYFNLNDTLVTEEAEPVTVMVEDEDEVIVGSYSDHDEDYSEPFRFSARYLRELRRSAPSWWERRGAGIYARNLLADTEEVF